MHEDEPTRQQFHNENDHCDMLHFDPTIDWSRKLLEPPIPDLLVVRSETPPNTDSPWQSSSTGAPWRSAWAEYAAVDRNEHHLAFTFFDTKSASKDEKLWIAEYTEKSTEAEKAVGWYRCKPSTEKPIEALSKSMSKSSSFNERH